MHRALAGIATAIILNPLVASAVWLNPDGVGQALLYPYYTVRDVDGNAFNTFISVVNDTFETKALRVRFREGRNGREVAGFNLFLAGRDTWTGAVTPAAPYARLLTTDRSCTSPALDELTFVGPGPPPTPVYALSFNADAYTGGNSDGLGDTLERTHEGYVEVIEMATLRGVSAVNAGFSLAASNGTTPVPNNCAALRGAATLETAPPSGGLSGTLTLINVALGMDFTVNAEALADLATRPFYRPASDAYPDFDAAEIDPVSAGIVEGKSYRATWSRGADAVSSVLMAARVDNEWVLELATRSRSDWIVTFPTRRFYTNGAGVAPPFKASLIPGCPSQERFSVVSRDRDNHAVVSDAVDFATRPPPPAQVDLCWTATAIRMQNAAAHTESGPFGSRNLTTVPDAFLTLAGIDPVTGLQRRSNRRPTFQSGWSQLRWPETVNGFANASRLTSRPDSVLVDLATGIATSGALKFVGLPVTGFMARTFMNGNLSCAASVCQGNYGGAFPHRYGRIVEMAP